MSSLVVDSSRPWIASVSLEAEGALTNFRLDQRSGGAVVASPVIVISVPMDVAMSEADGVTVRAYPPPNDLSSDGWSNYLQEIAAFEAAAPAAFPSLGAGSGRQSIAFIDGHYGLIRITTLGAASSVLISISSSAPGGAGPGVLLST